MSFFKEVKEWALNELETEGKLLPMLFAQSFDKNEVFQFPLTGEKEVDRDKLILEIREVFHGLDIQEFVMAFESVVRHPSSKEGIEALGLMYVVYEEDRRILKKHAFFKIKRKGRRVILKEIKDIELMESPFIEILPETYQKPSESQKQLALSKLKRFSTPMN